MKKKKEIIIINPRRYDRAERLAKKIYVLETKEREFRFTDKNKRRRMAKRLTGGTYDLKTI